LALGQLPKGSQTLAFFTSIRSSLLAFSGHD
jgi:hypothetical protein